MKKIRWLIFRIGVLFGLGFVLLFNSTNVFGQKASDLKPVSLHIIFLIDNSLSMAGSPQDKIPPSDPNELRIKTAKLFVECLRSETTKWSSCIIAPIRFSNKVNLKESYFFSISDPKLYNEIYSQKLSGTDFVNALEASLGIFRNESFGRGNEEKKRVVVLFSDGEPQNELERVEQQTEYFKKIANEAYKLKGENVQLYLLGFGQNHWKNYWKPILLPGRYIEIPRNANINKLRRIIQNLIDNISGSSENFSSLQVEEKYRDFIIKIIAIITMLFLLWKYSGKIDNFKKKIVILESSNQQAAAALFGKTHIKELIDETEKAVKDEDYDHAKQLISQTQEEFIKTGPLIEHVITPDATKFWEIYFEVEKNLNKQREQIYQCAKGEKGTPLRNGLVTALKRRWVNSSKLMIEEIYGIIESDGLAFLEFLIKEEEEEDPNNDKVSNSRRRLCSYLIKFPCSKDNFSMLLAEGKEIFQWLIENGISGSDEMLQFYNLLRSLEKPFDLIEYPLNFGIDEKIPTCIRKIITIMNECFNPEIQMRFPAKEMTKALIIIKEKAENCIATEGRILIRIAEQWEELIRDIENNPQKYKANIVLELSPSFSKDIVEEKNEDAIVKVTLPVALRNNGQGRAFNITIDITENENCIIDQKYFKLIKRLDTDQIEIANIVFSHFDKSRIKVKKEFFDLVKGRYDELEEYLPDYPEEEQKRSITEPNPYFLTNPISENAWETMVFERNEQVNQLLNSISKQKMEFITIKGLRRTGKTTLLRHFCNKVAEMGNLSIEIDCLLWQVAWEKYYKQRKKAWDNKIFLAKLAGEIVQAAQMKDSHFTIAPIKESISIREFSKLVDNIYEKFEKKPLLIAFDEADSLEYGFEKQGSSGFKQQVLYLCLRPLVKQSKIILVFVHEKKNPFWEDILEKGSIAVQEQSTTSFLSCAATIDLARKPAGIIYTPLAEEYIWRITGGYPALIQYICYHIYKNLRAELLIEPIRAIAIKEVVQNLLKKDIKYINYLRYSFTLIERRLLITLVQHKKVSPETGQISSLHYNESEQNLICLDEELYQMFLDDWPEEKSLNVLRKNNPGNIREELSKAVQDLEAKEVICSYQNEDFKKALRLRIGFFYLLFTSSFDKREVKK